MPDPALIGSPVFGLRAWRVVRGPDGERLAGVYHGDAWAVGGEWTEAVCGVGSGHAAPASDCTCGVYALHPCRASARAVLSTRGQVAGVLEAMGGVELHEDGFRAARARPFALFVGPRRNAALIARLAATYRARVVEVSGPDDVLAWCRGRQLGLSPATVASLLGAAEVAAAGRRHRRERWAQAARLAAVVAVLSGLVVAGLMLATDPPGERTLFGRTGKIRVHVSAPDPPRRNGAIRRNPAPRTEYPKP